MHENKLDILIVDDEIINILILEEIVLQLGHNPITFESPLKALEYLSENEPDIILVDYMMPKMDGITFVQKAKEIFPETIAVMITAAGDNTDLKHRALHAGMTDFLLKPIDVVEVQLRIKNLGELRYSRNLMKSYSQTLEKEVQEATRTITEGYHETLQVLSKVAEYKDPETSNHVNRVAHYCRIIARKLGLSEEDQEIVFYAAPLHDVGKVSIKDSILLKPGKLTDDEFIQMKEHSLNGYTMLENVRNPYLRAGALIALSHHERYDGKGYPRGIMGEEIPLFGRITSVADVFDALTSKRPYKEPWSIEKACNLLQEESGKHFDPKVIEAFFGSMDEIMQIYKKFED